MITDIFIRSYYEDLKWLVYCLQSIRKFCHGFRRVILVVPEASRRWLDKVELGNVDCFYCENYRDDYLGQQVTKLSADAYSNADYFCHLDSDCIFCRTTAPEDFFEGGKIEVVMTPYGNLPRSYPWRSVTERFLKREMAYDFMQRQPMVLPRWLYGEFHSFARELHGMDLEKYILSQPSRGFSEYNSIYAFAYLYYRDRFAWLDTSQFTPREFCKWYRSWVGPDPQTLKEIQMILNG